MLCGCDEEIKGGHLLSAPEGGVGGREDISSE